MRRKPGALVPLEVAILDAAAASTDPFHGFEIATRLGHASGARSLTAHGTLYKALARLAASRFLADEWEDPAIAAAAGRPRRRLYRITGAGAARLAEERRAAPVVLSALQARPT